MKEKFLIDKDTKESEIKTDLAGNAVRSEAGRIERRSVALLRRAENALARARAATKDQDPKPS